MFMPHYYAICVLVASNLLRSLLVVNVWQMCEEGRRSEGLPTGGGGKINEDEKDPVLSRSEASFQPCSRKKRGK